MPARGDFQRKLSAVFFLLGYVLFFLNCASDKVTWDLTEYVNQGVLNISQLERSSLEHYSMATGAHYTTERHLYNTLKKNVIPEYKRFLCLLRQIRPSTREVRRLHSLYLNGAESMYRGFKLKMLGLETNDEMLIRTGNEKIETGREQTEKWRLEMASLSEAHQRGWVVDLWGTQ